MLFTIAISIYNGTNELIDMINSLLSQSKNDNFEILLLNDGSTNKETVEICENFSEKYPNVRLFSQEDLGLCSARNTSLKLSKSKYILFLDQDDLLYSCAIQNITTILEGVEYDIVTFGYDVNTYNDKKEIVKKVEYRTDNIEILGELAIFNYFGENVGGVVNPVWNKAYRVSFLKDNKLWFNEDLKMSLDDFEFNIRAFYVAKSVFFADFIGYHYVYSLNSSSRKFRIELFRQSMEIFADYLTKLKLRKIFMNSVESKFYQYFFALSIMRMYENISFSNDDLETKIYNINYILSDKNVINQLKIIEDKDILNGKWSKWLLKLSLNKNVKLIINSFLIKKKYINFKSR
ncbi:MAG: glycosyltransferase [Erysipelotrichaceae bacterium]